MSAGSFSGAEPRKCDAGRSSIADSCPAPSSQVPLYWALDPSRARRIYSIPTNKPTWTRKRSLRTRAREPTSRPQRAPRPRIAEDNEAPGSDLTSFEGLRTLGHVVVGRRATNSRLAQHRTASTAISSLQWFEHCVEPCRVEEPLRGIPRSTPGCFHPDRFFLKPPIWWETGNTDKVKTQQSRENAFCGRAARA